MIKIPRPTKQILEFIKVQEITTPEQIQRHCIGFNSKDIKYALRRLREKGIIKKIPNLGDMRRVFYRIANVDEFSESLLGLKPNETNFFISVLGI